ncbi:MAG TPA: hypothetical protein PKI72_07425, partial [Giesbergeria sp.]|nr:hypothetical protein [Giesbergeria sp.]
KILTKKNDRSFNETNCANLGGRRASGFPWGQGVPALAPSGATACNRICYTARMFIHRVFITGRSDRGAWPWRKPVCLNT